MVKKMKKIGLCIEFFNRNNYGTMLQALATKVIVENLGYNARVIRYKKHYTLKFIVTQLPRLFDPHNLKGVPRKIRIKIAEKKSKKFVDYRKARANAFKEFRQEFFPTKSIDEFYGFKNLQMGSVNYNGFVVGSDQLWLPQGIKTNFYNLMFVPEYINKISYATSFGVSSIPPKTRNDYRQYLKRINFLSVREESGKSIIKDICSRDAFVACDPVMLLPKEKWDEYIMNTSLPPKVEKGKYLLCYFLGNNINARKKAKEAAKALNLDLVPLIFLEDYLQYDEDYGDIAPKGVDPKQFIQLIKNAAYIITDSFHGTVFSIIYGKQFLTVYRFSNKSKFSKNTRIDNILGKFNLKDRLYVEGNCEELLQNPINYNMVSKILESWKSESMKFLSDALQRCK